MKPILKYHLITYGCQMNKSDSERIAGLLNSMSGQAVEQPAEADLVVLNTCSVRQSAEDRVFGQVRNLVQLKKTNPRLVIAITGCLPGRDKDGKLRKKMPGVDLYFPINDLPRLPEMLGNLKFKIKNLKFNYHYLSLTPKYQSSFQAFIPIQTGCNNFCSYCVVPYARGREENRPLCQILKEIRNLTAKGCLEITLLGQVVNNYQAPDPENFSKKNPFCSVSSRANARDPSHIVKGISPLRPFRTSVGMARSDDFAALLWEVNQIEGVQRLHFIAAEPRLMSAEVIEALALPKQINHLHLPAQSGSNKILQKMNRRYTVEEYLQIIKKIREKKPGMALGTDIVVGFPGENEEDFQQTVKLYQEADFDIAYLAQYSPRPGTAAYQLTNDVSAEEKERRWWILQKLMEEVAWRKNQAYLGKTVEVLVESGRKSGISWTNSGNSREMKLVEFVSRENWSGKIVRVKIEKAEEWRLLGQLAKAP